MIFSLPRRPRAADLPDRWPVNGDDWPLIVARRIGSRRISLRLCAVSDSLRVGAPARCSAATIHAFLEEHAARLNTQAAHLPPRRAFAEGTTIPFLGQTLTIVRGTGTRTELDETQGLLRVGGRPEHLPRQVRDALIRAAEAALKDAVTNAVARAAAFPPRPLKGIRVADPRGRWGSCAADGTLRFSWRLILAPPAALTYVAAHEVAHLAEMSHGPKFWAVVAALDPNAAKARAWLKRHAAELHRVGPPKRT